MKNAENNSLNIILDDFDNVDFSDLRMPMIVVYEKPSDCPNGYIARIWEGATNQPTNCIVKKNSINEIREVIPRWFCLTQPCREDEEKNIAEVWL